MDMRLFLRLLGCSTWYNRIKDRPNFGPMLADWIGWKRASKALHLVFLHFKAAYLSVLVSKENSVHTRACTSKAMHSTTARHSFWLYSLKPLSRNPSINIHVLRRLKEGGTEGKERKDSLAQEVYKRRQRPRVARVIQHSVWAAALRFPFLSIPTFRQSASFAISPFLP